MEENEFSASVECEIGVYFALNLWGGDGGCFDKLSYSKPEG